MSSTNEQQRSKTYTLTRFLGQDFTNVNLMTALDLSVVMTAA